MVWEHVPTPTLSLQIGMRGRTQTASAAHHNMTSAFQHASTVALTKQLRFFTFVMISDRCFFQIADDVSRYI